MRNVWFHLAFFTLTSTGALFAQTASGPAQTTPAAILTRLDATSAQILYHDRNDRAIVLEFVLTTSTLKVQVKEKDTVRISYFDRGPQHIAQSIELYPTQDPSGIPSRPGGGVGGVGVVATNTQPTVYSREGAEALEIARQRTGEKGGPPDTAATLGDVHRVDSLNAVVNELDNYKPVANATVTFRFAKSDLTKDDKDQLDAFAAQVSTAKSYIIEVTGGTDSTGPAEYNFEVSQRRAEAVVEYLASKYGIAPHRFYLVGFGKDKETAPNTTPEGRQQNRRVEIRLLTNMGDRGTQPPPS
jgi:outer membrane protein OmpA-like peptidoglycan-associated protein